MTIKRISKYLLYIFPILIFIIIFLGLFFVYNIKITKATPGSACSDSTPCGSNERCIPSGGDNGAGTCVALCNADADCPSGFQCHDIGSGISGKTCLAGEPEHTAPTPDTSNCSSNEDCNGEICASHHCIPCSGDTSCGSGKLCQNGRCVLPSDVTITPDDTVPSTGRSGGGIDYSAWEQRQIDAANSAERGIFTEGLTTECMAFGKCNTCDILKVIGNVFRFAFEIVGIVAVAVITLGGFTYVRSGGSEETIAAAKKIITAAVLGTVVVFAAWVIINTILNITGFNAGGGSWWNPSC